MDRQTVEARKDMVNNFSKVLRTNAVCTRRDPTHGWKSMVFNSNCFPKMTDFSTLGARQAVTYTLKVVVSKKWRETDTLLLHTTITIRAISNDLG